MQFRSPKKVDLTVVDKSKRFETNAEYEYELFQPWEKLYLFLYRELSVLFGWMRIYNGNTKAFDIRRTVYISIGVVFLLFAVFSFLLACWTIIFCGVFGGY